MLPWRVRAKPLGVGWCSDGSSCGWVFCGNVGFFVVYWFLREKLWDFLRICPTWHPSIPPKNTLAEGEYLRLHTTTIHTQKRDGSVFKTSHHDEFWEKWVNPTIVGFCIICLCRHTCSPTLHPTKLNSLTPKSVPAGTKNSRSEGFLLAKHKHTNIPTMMEPFSSPAAWFWWMSIPHPREPTQKGLDEAVVEGF
jgi:hypothetical protein